MSQVIEKFKVFYEEFALERMPQIVDIYAEGVVFEDAVHQVKGVQALEAYFKKGLAGLSFCRFSFERELISDETGFFEWVMLYSHPSLQGGIELSLRGCTRISIDSESGKITEHRDYYDLGEMLYEHVPVLRFVIRRLKNRLA